MMHRPNLFRQPCRPGDLRPMVRLCAWLFGDRLFGARIKFSVTVVLACLLSYVLLSPNPWWILGIFGGESVPATGGGDKLYHFIGYFGLTLVFLWYSTSKSRQSAWLLIGTAAVHGGATECLQSFIPGRFADLADFGMNLCGIAVGGAVGLTLRAVARGSEELPRPIELPAGESLRSVEFTGKSADGQSEPATLARDFPINP